VSFVHRSGPNPFELFGTEGSITMGAGPLSLTSTRLSDDEIKEYIDNGPDNLPSAMQQWINAIEDDSEMTITIQDGRNLTELLQAAYMSSDEGVAVELPL
jgi:predicted dehydrogenase